MRLLVHDHSGHPFQAELSRELATRGHTVVHSYVSGYVSGKGRLVALPGETLVYEGIGGERPIDKQKFVLRLFREITRAFALVAQARRVRADVVVVSNVQIPTLVLFAMAMAVLRKPWVLWHQDVYAVAVRSMVGTKLPRWFAIVAFAFEVAERWCSRRAAAIVVIADSFVAVHEKWGTADKVVVIPNWAPLDEIVPVERRNAWSREFDLDEVPTLVYSGTLGLKHNPGLLPQLAAAVEAAGIPVRLVVVSEGPAVDVLREKAAEHGVSVTLLPFQPYERLSEVLGSGDVLMVLLERDAGAFSVPSKTLSYLCAGRPIVGLMPAENAASAMILGVGGCVLPPTPASIAEAAEYVVGVLRDPDRAKAIGQRSRHFAEQTFALRQIGDKFDALLHDVARSHERTEGART